MKVNDARPTPASLPWRARLAALAALFVAALGIFPTGAFAITRATVLTRAHHWVVKKVIYSQHATFAGYRRDCSGFVSMAWKLGRSYTSATIHRVATHIPLHKLQPGDAVHTPGHVAIFVRWANKAHTRYVAMEEARRGRPAYHHTRPLGHHATALRYRRITADPVRAAVAPLTGVSPVVSGVTSASADDMPSMEASASGIATAAASALLAGTAAALPSADAAPTHFISSASQPIGFLALVPISY